MNPESEFTRKKLTKFLCQELLYEYVTHNLEHAREKEVTDYLATCRDSQRELDNLNKGLRFAQVGAKVKVSPALLSALENFEPHWKKQLQAWTLWSSTRGWRTLPYVFVVLVLALGVVVVRPWVNKPSTEITLAEQLKQEPDMVPTAAAESVVMAKEDPPADKNEVVPQYKADLVESVVRNLGPAIRTFKPSLLIEKKEEKVADVETKETMSNVDESMGRGYLFRSVMEVQDFQNSWPAIRDKIIALGGKVAGNVELGWLRKPDEAYFHFTLPESNMNELEIFLGTFGPVQFSKDRHPRVMPEGQIRIIMSVKEGMTQNEAPAETP